jgi:hypothetical protein
VASNGLITRAFVRLDLVAMNATLGGFQSKMQ